jgi:hypothetical protein
MRDNRLPYPRVGRLLRFDRREVDAWMRGFSSALDRQRVERASRRSLRDKGHER